MWRHYNLSWRIILFLKQFIHTYKMFFGNIFFLKKRNVLWFFFWFDKFFLTKTDFSNNTTFLEESFFFLFILLFILIVYLLLFIDKRLTLSGCGHCITDKIIKTQKSHNNQMKPPKQYFSFYLHGQDEVTRGVYFRPQKIQNTWWNIKLTTWSRMHNKESQIERRKDRFHINWFYHYCKIKIR